MVVTSTDLNEQWYWEELVVLQKTSLLYNGGDLAENVPYKLKYLNIDSQLLLLSEEA